MNTQNRIEQVIMSRRNLIKAAALPVAFPLVNLTATHALAAEPLNPLNRFPRMVHEYFVDQVRAAEKRSINAIEKLKTHEEAQQHVETIRKKIRRSFGPEPERTPLNARITGTIEREAYKIEKLIFESRPGFPVTANVYVPKGSNAPMPGVVGTCGHSAEGKAAEAYQSFAQGLARQGYVVLIFDPLGQGERYQYVDDKLKPYFRGTVNEHLYAGNQQFLVGENLSAWRAWDGIRALDYLLTRKEVDPNHIGVTGNSGGGTMTTWLCGVEDRWTMAAPSCFVTTFRRNMENELPADTEQCPPRVLAMGLDHADFLAAMAPKPVAILAKEQDFFDARGSEEAYARLSRLYDLLGKKENISQFMGPTTHGYSQENREAMYRWFNKVTGVSDAQSEPDLVIEDVEDLWCTPNGQVAELKAKTVFDFTRERSKELTEQRASVGDEDLLHRVKDVLKLSEVETTPPDFRILRNGSARQYPVKYSITYAVESEPDVFAIVYMLSKDRWHSRPPRNERDEKGKSRRATLYVSHRSSDAELRDEPLIGEVIAADPEATVFTCDVRGIGESRPTTCGTNSFNNPYGCDYFYAVHSLMLDRPYVGQKTADVLAVLNFLGAYGYDDVHIVAKGWGAIPATFASMISRNVKQVTLKNALTSYADIAESEHYDWPLSTLLPNVIAKFDLPDCYRFLGGKQLKQVDPWGAKTGE